ncbi:Glutathione S-transferase GST-4.5 [Roseivivax jejudonensis]|uniref:Glutathione S-transferase GST-4.5 n=1 Tax=Roseivivax jejudonensis TaxID=1529041 RepID=A0A1X7A6C5_9RHOB|nr:glutathione S-transferase N-terminal domain-containing protein [Roseivivax jejudonensis]SLN71374.1 Glutathione S-transferase GST-4.5 [Roseivivax jejudonensis]
MRLFTMPGTCALAPNIATLWAGLPVEIVNLERGEHRKPDYLAINPKGQVPALELKPGQILTEAAAILSYIADSVPGGPLHETDPLDRARRIEALSYMTSEVHADFGGHFAPQRTAKSDAAMIEVREVTYVKLNAHFRRLDTRLMESGSGWYLDRRSIADPYLYILVRWIDGTPLTPGDYSHLSAFRVRMEADAHVVAALERQDMA